MCPSIASTEREKSVEGACVSLSVGGSSTGRELLPGMAPWTQLQRYARPRWLGQKLLRPATRRLYASCFTRGSAGPTHVGQVFDRDEYIRRNTEGVTEWRSQTLGPTDISIVGEVAVLLTVVTDVVAATEAEDAEFRMPVTQVWVRSLGKWQCLAGHAGPRLG